MQRSRTMVHALMHWCLQPGGVPIGSRAAALTSKEGQLWHMSFPDRFVTCFYILLYFALFSAFCELSIFYNFFNIYVVCEPNTCMYT